MPLLQLYAWVSARAATGLPAAAGIPSGTYRPQRTASHPEGERVIMLGADLVGRPVVHNMLHGGLHPLPPMKVRDHTRSKRRLAIEGLSPGDTLNTVVSTEGTQRLPTSSARTTAVEVPLLTPKDLAASGLSAVGVVHQSLAALGTHPRKAGF